MRNARLIGLFLVAAMMLALPAASSAQVALSITIAPPMLPVYSQPMCPASNYIWTPGYWAWGPEGYYWVPGTWVQPPQVGFLWTPGYWGWGGSGYAWNAGYWGPQVGFYGGVSYGYGYNGVGYDGGYWRGRDFYYNRGVTNVNVNINRHVYDRPFAARGNNRVSYNGGRGGIAARPNHQQQLAAREQHRPETSMQQEQQRGASTNRELRASVNHGAPAIGATERPGVFGGRGVVPTKGTPARAEATRPAPKATHPNYAKPAPEVRRANSPQLAPKMERKAAPKATPTNYARPAPKATHPNYVKPAPNVRRPNTPRPAPKMQRKAVPNTARPNHSPPPNKEQQKQNQKRKG
ncbi:MAG: hypothetical protein WBS54_08120 [Acidobacteriota bacterium]